MDVSLEKDLLTPPQFGNKKSYAAIAEKNCHLLWILVARINRLCSSVKFLSELLRQKMVFQWLDFLRKKL